MKRTPLRKVSEKRLEALGGYATSTFAPKPRSQSPVDGENGGSKPLSVHGLKTAATRRQSTGPDRLTVDAVLERDQHSCAYCGGSLFGERGRDWSIQHRRPRRAGGDPRPDTNSPANLVAVHGDGLTLCHGLIESYRTEAYAAGFLLHADAKPSEHQIKHAVHGWVYLSDDGRVVALEEVGA